ncbi:constitutive coactivator of PPAR-gamma-like protein 1 homolog isoform X2 [Oncorhynchus kisutch]|uniref:constitutive coactivator of PPAR-gamma-like protein 1 homolog isoform X2 n=1 Tax=Oncorhynchus kisutch TaxID=8019 RepID=UPI0012DF178B|nr:constitutive coactivator of PPAR-gamma-like protein 1 isoform X2 [Oncorhynchus kisutch]
MGVQGFQEYIEKHCPTAVVPVELQKLARGSLVGGGRQRPPQSPLRLLVDAENCLHRLYGGFYTDWVSGGQWNHMLGYLAALAKACFNGNIELLVCFNGAMEKGRLHEWVKRQVNERQTAQQIVSHIQNKGTPPPKVWFLPPVCMVHCIRLALLRFHIGVVQSIEDHHLEVISLCRENGFHGLVAYDSDYALCNIPYYFSAHALKLSRNGKSLTTSQYLMHEVAKQLDLNPNRFVIFASLLGNHILPDEDLAAFHWSLLGPEHPLASLKVRAHQLVLPPCDVVIKAVADYVRNMTDFSDLEAIANDIFRHSQSRTDDKVVRFKKAVEYYSAASKSQHFSPYQVGPNQTGGPVVSPVAAVLSHYAALAPLPQTLNIPPLSGKPGVQPAYTAPPVVEPGPGTGVNAGPGGDPGLSPGTCGSGLAVESAVGKTLAEQVPSSFSNIPPKEKHTPLYERSSPINPSIPPGGSAATSPSSSSSSTSSENEDNAGFTANHVSDHKGGWDRPSESTAEGELGGWDKPSESTAEGELGDQTKANPTVTSPVAQGLEVIGHLNAQIPSLLSMPTRNHMDITTPPLPMVAPEVLRVAQHRHKKGLMYPYIYHILTKGEIKLSVTIEDEANQELPSAVQLFRPIRQHVYGVLFSLAEAKKKAERLAMRRNRLPEYSPVAVKEWAAYKGKSPHTPELVEALPFREWTCPNLKKLWLGKAVEDKNGRMRAFLACMRSDAPAMLNPACVPTHLLVLCCVLRFMLQWPGVRVLRGKELDAFLAQALSPKLYEPEQLQELKIDNLDPRGVQLAALFMSGVDMALLANDVCGQPIPWEHCCPWMYFDGKLLQSKLIRAIRDKAPLIDLCDGQVDQVNKVKKMRQSILEGLNFSPPPPPHPHAMPFYPPGGAFYPPPHMMPLQGRSRSMGMPRPWSAGLPSMSSQGGKLEIAGTVVGQWAGIRRGRGRGGFPIQVVSVGGPNRGRLRGVISTPVIRTFGRGAKFPLRGFKSQGTYQVGHGTYQSKPTYSIASEVKERKKLKTEEKEKSPVMLSSDGSTTENGLEEREEGGLEEQEEGLEEGGVEEGVEESGVEQLKGQVMEVRESRAVNIQPESAFSSNPKMCNTNPRLNALNADGACLRDAAEPLSAAASVLQTEE